MVPLLLMTALGTASAAVNITTDGVSVDFSISPEGVDFSAVSVAGAGGDISNASAGANGLENPVTGVAATLAWPATVTNWTAGANVLAAEPTTSELIGNIRYVTSPGLFLTGPTGNRYQALIGRFRNATGFPLISFDLRWSLGSPVDAVGTAAPGIDPLAGIHVFYSKTGAANSWTLYSGPYALEEGPVPSETFVVPGRLIDNADLYIAWVDDNGPGSGTAPNLEGHFTIDDVQISNVVTGPLPCLLTATLTPPLRQSGADPVDTSDDVVTFSATIQTPRDPSAGWVILGSNPYFGTTGGYGVQRDFSIAIGDFSSGPLLFRFEDQADANCSLETMIIAPNYVHRVTAISSPKITFSSSAAGDGAYTPGPTDSAEPAWSGGVTGGITSSNVQTQPPPSSGSLKYFHLTNTGVSFTTDRIDVSALRGGILRGSVDFSFYSTNASGLEPLDELNARIEIAADGDFSNTAAGNITSTYIRNVAGDASAFGASIAAGPAYLNLGPGASQAPFPSAPFTFHTLAASAPVAAGAASPFARIVVQTVAGITTSEHILIDNITFSGNITPTLDVSVAGAATWSNGNTLTTADDGFSLPIRIINHNLGASTGWISNEAPARSGLYSAPGPVTFGPFPGRSPFSLQLRDALASPSVTSSVLNLAPPSASISAGVVTGSVERQDNGLGAADDTATLMITVGANNLGPQFTATPVLLPITVSGAGAYPSPGAALRLTLGNLPMTETTMNLEIADASYPIGVTPVTLEIVIPAASTAETVVVGRRDFLNGIANVQATGTPGVQWAPFPASRSLVMASPPPLGDAVVETEVLELSTVGTVNFTATLVAVENGTTSNFEIGDRFRAELIIDGDTANPVNLVDAFDTGSGFSATAASGQNGPKNGYINGYTGTGARDLLTNIDYSVAPLTSRDEYNANRARDEFNIGLEPGTAPLNRVIPLSATIRSSANSVQLRILGAGVSGTEAFIVKDVLFTETTGGDSDGDGASDAQESIAGTNPADPHDVLRLSQSAMVPGQIQFSSKPGRFYRVYVSDDADGSPLLAWRDAGLGTTSGDGGVRQFSLTPQPGKPRRYFRLHVMQSNGPWAP